MNAALAPMQSSPGREGSSRVTSFPARWVRFGMFQLDLQRQELSKNGARVKVQGKVYQALVTLLENPGEIVTREVLRTRMWPLDTHVNYDANVNTTVNKLRQVLGDSNDAPVFVETIPRKGYSFIAKVEYLDVAGATSARRIVKTLERTTAFFRRAHASMFLGADCARIWFIAGVITLLISAMLFGAAITLYFHRSF